MNKKKYFILSPPPNLTGDLHQGHILNLILQDLIISYCKHIHQINLESIFGFDHAALYAEITAKNQSNSNNKKEILDHIENNVIKYKESIKNTLKKYNFSYCNNGKELFTYSDDACSIVDNAISTLKSKNLLFLDKRVCFIDTVYKTTLSDLEVKSQGLKKQMFYIKYYYADNPDKYLVVATSRPETIEADICLAFHPDDKRYSKDIRVVNPISGKILNLITSKHVNSEFGTGLLKITPHFSITDEKICKDENITYSNDCDLYDLETLTFTDKSVFNKHPVYDAVNIAHEYLGSRQKSFIDKIESYTGTYYYSERNKNKVTTLSIKQYFVDLLSIVNTSDEKIDNALIVGCKGHIDIKQFIQNLLPWCISRQSHYGYRLDKENTLDTWFSSSLYPVIAIKSLNLDEDSQFIIFTAYDIMFFWIYRLFYMSQFALKRQSIHSVVVHGIVCDIKGNKISKSKLNARLEHFNTIIEREEYKVFLLMHNLFAKRILLDETKIHAVKKYFNKVKNILIFCINNNILDHDINDINAKDILIRYLRDKLCFILRCKELWNLDNIINNIEHIAPIVGRIISFGISDISGILIPSMQKNIKSINYKSTAAIISFFMKSIYIFAPLSMENILKELELNMPQFSLIDYIKASDECMEYKSVKILDMAFTLITSSSFHDELIFMFNISNSDIVENNLDESIYNEVYLLDKKNNIKIYFNTTIMEKQNCIKIFNLYNYAKQNTILI